MDTPQQPPMAGKTHAIYWVILVVVILAIAGGAYYFLKSSDRTTNTNTTLNSNAAANMNVVSNQNTSATSNTSAGVNTNGSTNTNSSENTADWQIYTNSDYGYTLRYPKGWKHSYKYEDDVADAPYEDPLHYSVITSADNQVRLVLGIERIGDVGTIYYRTGIGAGDIKAGNQLPVAGQQINTWQRVFEGRIVEVYLFPVSEGVSSVAVDGHEVTASFGITDSDTNTVDITDTNDYNTILQILQSLSLFE